MARHRSRLYANTFNRTRLLQHPRSNGVTKRRHSRPKLPLHLPLSAINYVTDCGGVTQYSSSEFRVER